ncbi:MAG: sigma-70 family RNA polymerase sigma factor [Bacteroides sp.]|nr:sigma-70 family RNA polymerase sigma factor [Bacteroides sp.]
MTNEQLAILIQQGGNDELIPILWEKVKKLLYSKSDSLYRLHKESCACRGVEVWDIRQASYTAFLEAIKAYKTDNSNKFTSYLNYPFKTAVNELLGLRTSRTVNEPLNNSTSLDKPIDDSSDSDVISLLDTIAGNTSLDFIDNMETNAVGDTVRAVVDTLSEPYKCVIKAFFFEGTSLSDIAKQLEISSERARQLKCKALELLRKNKILRELYSDMQQHNHSCSFSWFRTSPEYYETLKRLDKKPLSYGRRQAELYTAQIAWELQNANKG